MHFLLPLQEATLQRRYKRFLADVESHDGTSLTLHCPNTGSMKNCAEPNSRVWFWDSTNEKRKYPCTWELVEVEQRFLACINTQRANGLVVEAINNGIVSQLQGYGELKTEVR
jgi:sugar fermentation stimulation protein A